MSWVQEIDKICRDQGHIPGLFPGELGWRPLQSSKSEIENILWGIFTSEYDKSIMEMDWMDEVEGAARMDDLGDMDDIFITNAIDEMDFAYGTDAIPVVEMRDAEEIYDPTIAERGDAQEMDIIITGEMEDVIITEMDDGGTMMID